MYRNDCHSPIQGSKIATLSNYTKKTFTLTFTCIRKNRATFMKPNAKAILLDSQRRIKIRKAVHSLSPILCLNGGPVPEGISKISDLAGVNSLAFRTIIVESVECNADTRKRRRYLGFLRFCDRRSKSFGSNLQFLTRDGRG